MLGLLLCVAYAVLSGLLLLLLLAVVEWLLGMAGIGVTDDIRRLARAIIAIVVVIGVIVCIFGGGHPFDFMHLRPG